LGSLRTLVAGARGTLGTVVDVNSLTTGGNSLFALLLLALVLGGGFLDVEEGCGGCGGGCTGLPPCFSGKAAPKNNLISLMDRNFFPVSLVQVVLYRPLAKGPRFDTVHPCGSAKSARLFLLLFAGLASMVTLFLFWGGDCGGFLSRALGIRRQGKH